MPIVPRFLDPLQVAELDAEHWRLTAELRYDSAVLGARVVIPVGFVTDFASVPRIPLAWWWLSDIGRSSAVVHDWMYQGHLPADRALVDRIYAEALRAEGIPWWRRWPIRVAVRLWGWWAW